MRRLLGRGAVLAWVLVYWFTIHTPLPAMLVPVLGMTWAALITFSVVSLWALVFYFLLKKDGDLQKIKGLLKRLRGENSGIKGHLFRRIPKFEDESVLPIFWILIGFIIFGALGGVPIVKLTYPEKRLSRVLIIVFLGCALNVLVWIVLVYGPSLLAVRRFFSQFLGG